MPNRFQEILTRFWSGSMDESQQELFYSALQQEQTNHNNGTLALLAEYLQAVVRTACSLQKNSTEEQVLLDRLAHLQTLPEFNERMDEVYAKHIFQQLPDEALKFLENFSTEHVHLEPSANSDFLVRLGPEDALEIFFFRYDFPSQNLPHKDLYSGHTLPINGDYAVCGYDSYLPMHRILGLRYPQAGIHLGVASERPYIYVLTFKHFKQYVKDTQTEGLDFIPAHIWDDLRANRALLLLNDTFEAADYTSVFPLYVDLLRKRGVHKNVFLLSGDPGNDAVHRRFVQRLNRKPWWKLKAAPSETPVPFSFFSFRLFEEAMAQTKQVFYADYTLEHRMQLLRQSDAIRPFLCFNRIVKDYRVVASYLFFKHGLLPKTYISQDHFVDENDFRFGHNRNKALFALTEPESFEAFRQSLPWYVDTDNFVANPWNVLPMDIINRSFLWVVTETDFSKGEKPVFFITEKTYKPIAVFMPFIIIGNPYTLQSLRNEGYRTFSRWWDESYDQETDTVKRMEKIFGVLTQLARLDTPAWLTMLQDMQNVLQHNHDRLLRARSSQPAMEAIATAYRNLSA